MRILGIQRDQTACNHYRILQPLNKLSQHGLAEILMMPDLAFGTDLALQRIMEADLIVFQGANSAAWFNFVKTCRKHGKSIVLDYDDDPFNVSPWNPSYRWSGIEPVKILFENGKEEWLWHEDMKSSSGAEDFFNIEANIERRDLFRMCFKSSDLVSCSTPRLQEAFQSLNKNTVTLPNLIDPDLYLGIPEMVKKEVRIGWHGGSSHYEDLRMFLDPLKKILDKHDNVKFCYFGDTRFMNMFSGFDQSKIEFHPWVMHNAFFFKFPLLNVDIGVCPLVDNKFNRNKSAIKWMEYSMVGAAVIASNIPPYSDVISNLRDGILVGNSIDEWAEGLELLIKDKKKRLAIASSATENVLENYNADKKANLWFEAYEKVLKGEGVMV